MHKFRSPTLSFVFSLFLSLFLLPTLAFAQQLPTPPQYPPTQPLPAQQPGEPPCGE